MSQYLIVITLIGFAGLALVWLKKWTNKLPLSYPILFVLLGMLVYALPLNLPWPNPLWKENFAVHLTELSVIITLMGTGIKINRKFGLKSWQIPFRLIAITMLLCVAALALLGWQVLGWSLPAAMLLAAVLSPTDPVLAGDVQVGPPSKNREDQVRFSLTAEAGLNDGMAFPFTWLAIVMATAAATQQAWFTEWLWRDLLYRIVVGVGTGLAFGWLLGWLLFVHPEKKNVQITRYGFVAVMATLLVYGVAEMLHSYGFMAVFFAGVALRSRERHHQYHQQLHDFTDQIEHLLMVVLLVLFGGSIVEGLLNDLTWKGALVGSLFVLVVRPLFGLLGLIGVNLNLKEKMAISFFGIRGIGSFFYLAFALNEATFAEAEELWAVVGFTVLLSVVLHGILATPVMKKLGLHEVPEGKEEGLVE